MTIFFILFFALLIYVNKYQIDKRKNSLKDYPKENEFLNISIVVYLIIEICLLAYLFFG